MATTVWALFSRARYVAVSRGCTALLMIVVPLLLCGQSKTETPSFDVVSVKPLNNPSPNWQLPSCKGSRFLSQTTPVRYLAQWAYDAKPYQFVGSWPPWAETPQYRIEAAAAVALTQDACKGMVRALLADQFKLSLRRKKQAMDVYAFVVASKKVALRQIDTAGVDDAEAAKDQKLADAL